ncbi:MAG TPA: HAD-IA family hydrolase [Aquaticitalea sp.]|nr:HAD-IA family hydrolase [Aquaticitalea sp.]HNU59408.1 HAD-IA family hydrolase [Aquaticitalea sp.]
MLKAVLFDMDGVIVDTEPIHLKAYHRMFEDINIEVPNATYATFAGLTTLEVCKRLCKSYGLHIGPETLVDLKRDHYKYLFETDTSLTLVDGALELIQNYHTNGLKLVLASSASMGNIDLVMARFGLGNYFSAKISGADLKASKPHPEIFELAAKASGHKIEQCMVIEDSTNGIVAAKEAGIFCVAINAQNTPKQDLSLADLVINDYSEIHYKKIKELFLSTV